MAQVIVLRKSATLAAEGIAEQGNAEPETTGSKPSMNPLSKKPVKGGGNKRNAGRRKGGKKKVVKKGEAERSNERMDVSDAEDVVAADHDYDSTGDSETSPREVDDSDYKDISPVVKRAAGKGASSKTPAAKKTPVTKKIPVAKKTPAVKKTTTASGKPTRRPSTRKSAVAKAPGKKGGKSTPGKKEKAIVGDTAEENLSSLDDPENGYFQDDDNYESHESYPEKPKAPRTPAKKTAKKVSGKSVKKDTGGKTTRKTTADKKVHAEATGKRDTRSTTGRKAPVASESVREQEGEDDHVSKEPVMTTGTKRQAPKSSGKRLKKVAKTTAGKSVGAIKAGLKALDILDCDGGEAGGSGGKSIGAPPAGYSVEGGTSEQRAVITAAASSTQSVSVIQSEPVIGKNRWRYGGKSVAGLKALWEMKPPEQDSE